MESTQITKEDVHNFLTSLHLAVFATTNIDNSPHLSTMFYVVDHDLNFYFITKSETKKVTNISHNPHVSVVVSDKDSYKTVEASGVVVALSGIDKIKTSIQMFSSVYAKQGIIAEGKLFNWPPPLEKIELGEIAVYELKPSRLTYSDYSDSSPLDGNYVQEIISS